VLALQGAYREHVRTLEAIGARTRLVRLPADLEGLDGLVMPGGESTTMALLMQRMGLLEPLRETLHAGLPVLGTCAGMILLADRLTDGRSGQDPLHLLPIAVRRNAWGRQVDSFEAPVRVEALDGPFPGVFIRAPRVESAGDAEVIATLEDGEPVGVRKGRVMALAFHPELSGDDRLHREFLRLVANASDSAGPGAPTGGQEPSA
jgi:5'-phosphate synthase pdxT subunit